MHGSNDIAVASMLADCTAGPSETLAETTCLVLVDFLKILSLFLLWFKRISALIICSNSTNDGLMSKTLTI